MDAADRIIGVDESGKGDFFGPLVVASLLADQKQLEELADLGVRDSKLIADKKLLGIDEQLRQSFPHAVIIIPPEEYNRRWEQIRNLNKLLAWGHAEAIASVLASHEADLAISDKFGKAVLIENALDERKIAIPLQQLVRGEVVPQVAAASVLARAAFIREMDNLSRSCGMKLPKGAAPQVDQAGRQVVSAHGIKILTSIAKIHFKNYQRVTRPQLFV